MTITTVTLEGVHGELQQLPPKQRAHFTARDAVAALVGEIRAAQDQGYSLVDLAEMLTARGVKLSSSTLGSYLRALSRALVRTAVRKSATVAAG